MLRERERKGEPHSPPQATPPRSENEKGLIKAVSCGARTETGTQFGLREGKKTQGCHISPAWTLFLVTIEVFSVDTPLGEVPFQIVVALDLNSPLALGRRIASG